MSPTRCHCAIPRWGSIAALPAPVQGIEPCLRVLETRARPAATDVDREQGLEPRQRGPKPRALPLGNSRKRRRTPIADHLRRGGRPVCRRRFATSSRSEQQDLNLRPPAPRAGALAGLSYAPKEPPRGFEPRKTAYKAVVLPLKLRGLVTKMGEKRVTSPHGFREREPLRSARRAIRRLKALRNLPLASGPQEGFAPSTSGITIRRSNSLSYWGRAGEGSGRNSPFLHSLLLKANPLSRSPHAPRLV
jgi:hypothetical protein